MNHRGDGRHWKGDVEVFALDGSPEADCCFVWSFNNEQNGGKREFVSFPAVPPILSAAKAIVAVLEWEARVARK